MNIELITNPAKAPASVTRSRPLPVILTPVCSSQRFIEMPRDDWPIMRSSTGSGPAAEPLMSALSDASSSLPGRTISSRRIWTRRFAIRDGRSVSV